MSGNPKYLEVSAEIEAQVRDGRWDGGKMPSIRGVARQHGVSVVTASRAIQVLRDKGLIRTIQRAGCYRVPEPEAERWALVLRLTPGPWLKTTLEMTRAGFDSVACREPIRLESGLFPLSTDLAKGDILPLVRRAKRQGVRGAFFLPSRCSEEDLRLDECFLACCDLEKLPVVLLERNLRGHTRPLERDLVTVDDVEGAACLTRHLLERGRKRVAIVVASPTSSHNDRVAGYLYALYTAPPARPRMAKRKPIVLHQARELASREVYAALAEEIRELKVDGVVCYQNRAAAGLIAELLASGHSVPRDVAVVGFDDLPPGNPPDLGVTTYAYPSDRMAEHALQVMRERLRNPQRAPAKVVVPGRLIVRESSAGKRPTAHIMSGCPS
jgi:LacI family transcriptional regulator